MTLGLARRSGLAGDGFRFAVAGLVNTALTIVAYQLLLFYLPSQASYALSWVLGLVFVAVFYPSRVFVGGRTDLRTRLGLVASYGGIFLLGLGLMALLDRLGVPARLSIFLTIGFTTVVNFVAGRRLARGGRRTPNRAGRPAST